MDGEKLRAAIYNAGYTQRELARKIGIPESTLSNWLSRPSLDAIESICEATGIPMARILSDSNKLVELSDREREILELFNEFPRDKQVEIIEILRRIRAVIKP